jgi:vacuolar-type H+-ATPase subunit F/Vma7
MNGFVIGDSDMVTGFRLVGVQGAEASTEQEAQKAFEDAVSRNDLAIIIISEEFSSHDPLQKEIEKTRLERASPLIVEIPSSKSKPSKVHISDLVSKTLGIRL